MIFLIELFWMRGRKAFVGIRKFLENMDIYDPVLMSWVNEIADVGISTTTTTTELETLS